MINQYPDKVFASWRWSLGGACWLLTVLYFAIEPVVAAAWETPYSFARDTISLLGITECVPAGDLSPVAACSPRHALINGSFIVLGVLTGVGAVLLRGLWPRRRMATVGLTLIVVAAISTIATGLFPLSAGVAAHSLAALPQFPAQTLGLLLLGIAWWRDEPQAAVFSLLCGIASAVGIVLFFGATPWGLDIGVMERVAFYPDIVWTAFIGPFAMWRDRLARLRTGP